MVPKYLQDWFSWCYLEAVVYWNALRCCHSRCCYTHTHHDTMHYFNYCLISNCLVCSTIYCTSASGIYGVVSLCLNNKTEHLLLNWFFFNKYSFVILFFAKQNPHGVSLSPVLYTDLPNLVSGSPLVGVWVIAKIIIGSGDHEITTVPDPTIRF